MKNILSILLVLVSVCAMAQPGPPPPGPSPATPPNFVNRASAANVVVDQRLEAHQNFYVPRYDDTATANIPNYIGADTCSAIIYTYDVNKLWFRNCYPAKHWELIGTGANIPQLPDGVYSGGDVAWSGTGLIFNITPAIYVLNGTVYNYPGGTITLPAADPTFSRIDVILFDSTGANYKTGVPSANPQEPSVNPQTQIRRALVTIPANSPTPAVQTNIVYDQNMGTPTEWNVSSTGTVLFGNTNFPYHLNIAAAASGFVDGQTITFTYTDTINTAARGSLVGFIRLGGTLGLLQNFIINLYHGDTLMGQTLLFTTYGLNRNLTNTYQPLVFPTPAFSPANLVINKIVITAVGPGAFPQFNLDFLQFQTGILPISTIPDQRFGLGDNFMNSDRAVDFNRNRFGFNNVRKLIIGSEEGSLNDSLFVIIKNDNGSLPLLRVNSNDNFTYLRRADIGNGIFDAYETGVDVLNVPLSTRAGAWIQGVQQTLTLKRSYPFVVDDNPYTYGVRIENDTLSGTGIFQDSALYIPLGITYQNHNGVTTEKWRFYGDGTQWRLTLPYNTTVTTADTLLMKKNGFDQGLKISDLSSLLGVGASNSNLGAGFRLVVPGTGGIKTLFSNVTGAWDSTSNANGLTYKVDTTVVATRAYASNLVTTYFNTNVGSSYRFAIPGTNTIKTLRVLNGILADSATANTISIQIDSSVYATKGFVNSVAGGGGFTGVTSVSVANANGFFGSVATSTTTPVITIIATPTGVLKSNGTAISAATVGTDYSVGTSSLATGILKTTTATGALSIAVAGDFPTLNQNTNGTASNVTGTVLVTHGGTGLTTLTAFGLMAAGTTATGNMQQVAIGTSGQVLTSNGAGALPTFQTPTVTGGVASITGTANQVIASAATGAVTLSLPQSIATTSNVVFGRGTFGGAAATANLILPSHTDPTAAAGVITNNGTRLAFSLATTYKRFIFSNDVTPTAGQGLFGNGTDFTVGAYTAADNGMVVTASATGVTFRTNSTFQTLTSGATITWNVANGENANLTLANTGATLNIQNPVNGHTYVIAITQGTGGSRTITTWPAGTIWPGGTPPTLGTAVGAKNLISLVYNGTNFYGAFINSTYQ